MSLLRLLIRRPIIKPTTSNTIQTFSTTPRTNAIPPILWLVVKPITKVTSLIFGRVFRKWWRALPVAKKQIFNSHLGRNKHRYGLIVGSAGIGSLIFYQTHIQTNPITQRKRFILFTRDQIDEVSQLGYDFMMEENKKKVIDPKSKMGIRALNVANKLIHANKALPGVREINWSVNVIDSPMVNAVAFPSGSIIVYTGLIDHCKTDDELAIIIGHEMSHAILEHSVEAMSFARLTDILTIGLIFVIWSVIPHDSVAVLVQAATNEFMKIYFDLPYSRELESEADRVGLMIASRACFDVRKSVTFWSEMGKSGGSSVGEKVVELEEYLSTHPSHENRSAQLLELMPQALQLRTECNCHELEAFTAAKLNILKK